ncbi:MAG: Serine--tRNA ligase, mitochondrial [Icmadophila ericetorum]|nr:Serine--tRNA ligase, mitochondrial [Icmadophila ericetorum]
MASSYSPRACLTECLNTISRSRRLHFSVSARQCFPRPSFAPKPAINIKAITDDPHLHSNNCVHRKYESLKEAPFRIIELREERVNLIRNSVPLRKKMKSLHKALMEAPKESEEREKILERLRCLKEKIKSAEEAVPSIEAQIEDLAESLPNLTSEETPLAHPKVQSYIWEELLDLQRARSKVQSHVQIGDAMSLIDFTSASTSSGWGYYFLTNGGALLEHALVQYALATAATHGFKIVTPPSLVYSHIASACGFKPRDQNGERQIYSIAQKDDVDPEKPELVLAGTAEIPFAAMKANTTLESAKVPLKVVGASRCYRAEAGSRGVDTKGLYRVHEFTKVEMFAWTPADFEQSTAVFNKMLRVQEEIVTGLHLPCRVVEQPASDLGASAYRKRDIEAYFPSRSGRDQGWGEITSASMCTDYQTRRLATKMHVEKGVRIWKHTEGLGRDSIRTGAMTTFPWTVNGTALAVPRVLAALLENHYDENARGIWIPECLRQYLGHTRYLYSDIYSPSRGMKAIIKQKTEWQMEEEEKKKKYMWEVHPLMASHMDYLKPNQLTDGTKPAANVDAMEETVSEQTNMDTDTPESVGQRNERVAKWRFQGKQETVEQITKRLEAGKQAKRLEGLRSWRRTNFPSSSMRSLRSSQALLTSLRKREMEEEEETIGPIRQKSEIPPEKTPKEKENRLEALKDGHFRAAKGPHFQAVTDRLSEGFAEGEGGSEGKKGRNMKVTSQRIATWRGGRNDMQWGRRWSQIKKSAGAGT